MAISLRWIVSTAASSLHAAAALLGDAPVVDPRVATSLDADARALEAALMAAGCSPAGFLDVAIPRAAKTPQPAELVAQVASDLAAGRSAAGNRLAQADAVAERIKQFEQAFLRVFPRVQAELELRAEPIRGQWEARGPGLLHTLSQLTRVEPAPAAADVILLQPLLSGAGAAYPLLAAVSFEAVLANPHQTLPEVVRLGWLIAQLNLSTAPWPTAHLPAAGRAERLALVPPVIEAAEQVELTGANIGTVTTAVGAWRLGAVDPALLWSWWQTARISSGKWPDKVAALQQMLSRDSSDDQP